MRRTDNVSLWPWHLTLEVTAIVGHTRLGTVSEYQVQILVILRLFVFDLRAIGPTWLTLITWPCNLDLWSRRLWLMQVVVLHPWSITSLKFVGLETGMRVASKVGNLLYKFGHSKPSLNYLLCIRWMDRLMDKSNTYCPFCTGPGA